MDIEKVASETPNKIVTIKIDLKKRDLVKKKLKR